jgi:hypothetical protein
MGTTDRMKIYLEYKGISKYSFYKTTGFSNKFLDNSSNMGTDRAEIILRYYPDINPEWFITGSGEMLKTNRTDLQNTSLVPIAQVPDGNGKDTNNNYIVRENTQTIDKLLSRLENQSEEIGRLKTIIEELQAQGSYKRRNYSLPIISSSSQVAEPQTEYK